MGRAEPTKPGKDPPHPHPGWQVTILCRSGLVRPQGLERRSYIRQSAWRFRGVIQDNHVSLSQHHEIAADRAEMKSTRFVGRDLLGSTRLPNAGQEVDDDLRNTEEIHAWLRNPLS